MTRKQRRTQSRAQAARANGAKSQGPVTPEGKAKSAQNAIRHGVFANSILLETESPEQFDQLVNDYIDDYAPQNESQLKIVYRMAAATWRQQRAEGAEAALINEKMHEQHPGLAQRYNTPEIDPAVRTAFAMAELYSPTGQLKALQNAIDLCQRQFSRAFRDLERAKKLNNEPKAIRVPEESQAEPQPDATPAPEPETHRTDPIHPETKNREDEPKPSPAPPPDDAPPAKNPPNREEFHRVLDRVARQHIEIPKTA